MKEFWEYFAHEDDLPDLDIAGAAERLGEGIRCRTVSYIDPDLTDWSAFDRLHAHIRASYPHIMAAGTFEVVGRRGILITLPGRDDSLRPCLFMAHQDVVPVVEGTEDDWRYPAFSGVIAEGCVWGRGTLDIKQQVFGCLEAAEYVLAHGGTFARTVYLAFGDDEENLGLGAKAIAELLRDRGVRLEFLLDEGSCRIVSGAAYGAPDAAISTVDLQEKGYADLELSVKSAGGHSSRPFGGTSLGRLSQAIARIVESPFPVRLTPVIAGAFKAVAPYVTEEPLRTLVRDVDANADAIARYCCGERTLFPFVTTTVAPTVIRGGSAAANVMPQDMTAIVNFRIAEGETAELVLDHARAAVRDPAVSMRFVQANEPSAAARRDGFGYASLLRSLDRYFPEVVFIPALTVGATDARHYEIVCDSCLRFSPFMGDPEEVERGVHGTDERISIRSYAQGIRVLVHLMESTAVLSRP